MCSTYGDKSGTEIPRAVLEKKTQKTPQKTKYHELSWEKNKQTKTELLFSPTASWRQAHIQTNVFSDAVVILSHLTHKVCCKNADVPWPKH